MKVLVADDSRMMRTVIRRSLETLKVDTILEAADGAEAVTLYQDNTDVDLVLSDWNMPNKTGIEVLREIRAQDSKVPVILITTEADRSRVMEAIEAGVSDYIVKPFDTETLREKLEKHGCGACA